MRLILSLSLLLLLITVCTFWQSGGNDFISLDDGDYITENPHVLPGITLDGIKWAFTSIDAANWHPLTWLSHMADCHIYGMNPKGHHLTSVFIHAANALLLFLFLSLATKSNWRSFFVAALFAVHPLHIESVAWAAERKDVLSAFFFMLTLITYMWHVQRPGSIYYHLSLSFFIMGLMAKPMIVTLPIVLLLLDYWPFDRASIVIGSPQRTFYPGSSAGQPPCFLLLLREKIPFFFLSAASSIITIYAQKTGGALAGLEAVSFPYRVANAVVAYAAYLTKMVWPINLAIFYPLAPVIPTWKIVTAGLFLVFISIPVVKARHNRPFLLVGWLWYLATLVPVIGLIQAGGQAMADRYTYLPLIGVFIMLVWWIADLANGWRHRNGIIAAGTLILLLLCCGTWLQIGHWKNSLAIFKHALTATYNNKNAFINLGVALTEAGRNDLARVHYTNGTNNSLYAVDAHINLGILLAKEGKHAEAIGHYMQALQLKADDADGWYNMGLSLACLGRMDEAVDHFRKALFYNTDDADAHYNLAVLLMEKNLHEEAMQHFAAALRLKPGFIAAEQYLKSKKRLAFPQ